MVYGLSSINSREIELLNYSPIYSSLTGDVRTQASLKCHLFWRWKGHKHHLSPFHLKNLITLLHKMLVLEHNIKVFYQKYIGLTFFGLQSFDQVRYLLVVYPSIRYVVREFRKVRWFQVIFNGPFSVICFWNEGLRFFPYSRISQYFQRINDLQSSEA